MNSKEKNKKIIEDLKNKIHITKLHKKKFENYLSEVKKQHQNREITYQEYLLIQKKRIDGKTISEWILYYQGYIESYERKIKELEKSRSLFFNILIILGILMFIILVLILFALFLESVLKNQFLLSPEQEYFKEINLNFSNSQEIEFSPDISGQLTSLKITGNFNDTGAVNVYLDDLLILNTSSFKELISLSPKNKDKEKKNKSKDKNESEEISQIDFIDHCETTCNLSLNKNNYKIKIEINNSQIYLESINYVIEEISKEIPQVKPKINRTEIKSNRGKKIILSGDDNLTNVIVNETIPDSWNIKSSKDLRLFWENNNEYVNFNTIDTNSDGNIDLIEWTVPHFSEQTFEIIVITNAIHLDNNREFISNIYEESRSLDNVWSGTISNNEYARVTFEKNLTNVNDITIYPRIINGNPSVEIYEFNSSSLIAEFASLNENTYNTIILNNLIGEQDTFDLRIVGGSIELDHIIDPTASPSNTTDLRAQICSAESSANNPNTYTDACVGTYPSSCPSDLISCNDGNVETQNYQKNKYAGVRIESYNSTINNCNSITNVRVCYEWWSTSNDATNCIVAVDSNGGSSYSTVSTSCPGTTANPGVICTDITSLEAWSCNNFFGASGTRALARTEVSRTSGGPSDTLSVDSLYFEVDYSQGNTAPTIINIDPIANVDLLAGTTTNVTITFTAEDLDGASDLNSSTTSVSFSRTGETTRTSPLGGCNPVPNGLNQINYSCNIAMQYYDDNGLWNISVSINDSQNSLATNNSETFTVNLLRDIIIAPTSFSFPSAGVGSTNLTSLSTTNITNLGNYETVSDGPIQITAFDLHGLSNQIDSIPASNFRAESTGGSVCSTGEVLSNNSAVTISSLDLSRGPGENEEITYCLTLIPTGIGSQSYSTTSTGNPWIISILLAGILVKRKRKEELLEFLEENFEEIVEIIKENKLKKESEKISIPLEIFKENVGGSEILSKYLKENLNLKFREIAKLINRDERTVALNYKHSKEKIKEKIKVKKPKISIQVKILSNRKLSILESIIYHLRNQGMKNIEISKLLGKDPRNTGIFYSRAIKKLKE